MKKRALVTAILEKTAKRMGVEIHIESRWGYVGQLALPDGRKRYFRNTNLDLNGLGASEIARDKNYAEYFLRRMGYPVIQGDAFCTAWWAAAIGDRKGPLAGYRYAKRLGFPVIVKPNSSSQGSGVARVATKLEFVRAVKAIEKKGERMFLVQRVVTGHDYRLVVLDSRIISAYERLPLSVTGNGRSTIHQLLLRKQKDFNRLQRNIKIKLYDPRIDLELKRQGMSRRSIPAKGARVVLLPNANLSTGGDAIDATDCVHPKWKALAIRLAKDMNLRYAGIDIMSQQSLEHAPVNFVVIEVNAAPGIDNYAAMGRRQQRLVENLYREVLKALLV